MVNENPEKLRFRGWFMTLVFTSLFLSIGITPSHFCVPELNSYLNVDVTVIGSGFGSGPKRKYTYPLVIEHSYASHGPFIDDR